MKKLALAGIALALLTGRDAAAQWTSKRPDGHAPIGVMGDHRHEAGEVMLSYRFMRMSMQGSRLGSARIADAEIVSASGQNFTVTPTEMPMTMHMFGAMVAPSDRITLMAMLPVISKDMTHLTRAGGSFTTSSSGIGDVSLAAMIGLADWGNQTAFLTLGASAPTGSITAQDVLPTSNGAAVQLPYPMQLGTGSWGVLPGITWLGEAADWSWGGQAKGAFNLGDNDRGWKVGNKGTATFWGARRLNQTVSASLRVAGSTWGDISGQDAAASVNPAVVPTARPDLRGGTRFDAGIGLNLSFPKARGLRFAGEFLVPMYQNLHGPQLETDWQLVAGIQLVPVH
ncbi:MAG: hypothetical protein R2882_02120 [Gemmatimonadales bacterium]